MERAKKITIAVAAIAAAGALVTAGAFALFSDSAKTSSQAVIGGVEIAPIEIMIGNASVTKNIDSEFISTYTYYRYDGTNYDVPSEEGYWSEQNAGYTPRWKYREQNQGVEINYFRTSDGEVAYCMDLGKHGPSSGAANEETIVSEMANRVLAAGYPNKTAADYQAQFAGLTDIELEWATQVALKIVEGTAYEKDSSTNRMVENDNLALKLSDFDSSGGDSSRIIPTSASRTDEAVRMFNVVSMLVEQANGTTVTSRFTMSVDDVSTVKEGDFYKVGPYKIETNYTDPIQLVASNPGAYFTDENGNTTTTVNGNASFYAYVPASATEQVDISVSIPGKNIPASYYYWTGADDEQKMLVAKTIPVEIESTITTTFDRDMTNWNPGDISTVKWDVENVQNKSIDTRNTVYLYWEDADMMDKSPVYMYPDSTANIDIYNDMKSGVLQKCIDLGGLKTFSINGQQHTGYMWTVNGDTLDGVGDSAETGDAKEVNYSSTLDDASKIMDTVSFKLALSPYASYESQKKNFKIVVVTEAKQYRNTKDASEGGWDVVGTAEVNF